jgi:peroxiredoxin
MSMALVNESDYLEVFIMKDRTMTAAIAVSTVIFFVMIMAVPAPADAAPPAPWEADELVGKPAPDFTLNSLDALSGKPVTLSSFKGKVVLVNFWVSWCSPCKEEFPAMNRLYNKYKDKGFVVIGVSMDSNKKAAQGFLKDAPVNFINVGDPDLKVSRKKYKVFSQPMTYLIDKNGKLVKKYFGEVDWMNEEVQKEIAGLL